VQRGGGGRLRGLRGERLTNQGPVYSERLGAISDAQFAAAAARLGLGAFVTAKPIRHGLFGQNVFLTTSAGEFVLRGAPHWYRGQRDDRYQFAKEAFFIRLVHERTGAPAPWPCHYDPMPDIFGWPYLVMPRMPGDCFNERTIRKARPPQARREVAASIGATLAKLQRLTAPAAGDYDPDAGALAFHSDGYRGHLIRSITEVTNGAEAAGVMTAADMEWRRELVVGARDLPARPVTFVHGDYKLDNMTVVERDGAWRVGGLFDFHTARFGDSARDIVRSACAYLDTEPELARVMIAAWRAGGGDTVGLDPWLPLYVASERSSIWAAFVKADARPRWSIGHTFRSWTERYLEQLAALI
jgi:aminoglycoside phosphotransferase (APT) family kinase protein